MEAETKSSPSPVFVVAAALVLLAGGFAWWWLRQPPPVADVIALTPEAKSYVRHLGLAEVEMKATESIATQALVEITGKITNNGDRPVDQVDLNAVFYDPYGQIVLRERVSIVRPKSGGLAPGQTKKFRLAFDSVPQSWNQAMPQLVIAGIRF